MKRNINYINYKYNNISTTMNIIQCEEWYVYQDKEYTN